MNGGHIDDAAPPLGQHVWQAVFGAEERAGKHDTDQKVPLLLGKLVDRSDVLEPGVVDQDVELAERLNRRVDHAANVISVANVCVDGNRPRPTPLKL